MKKLYNVEAKEVLVEDAFLLSSYMLIAVLSLEFRRARSTTGWEALEVVLSDMEIVERRK